MSQENVEVVRRTLTVGRDQIADVLDPAVRIDLSERVFNPAVYEGYEGIARWRAEVNDVWESYRMEPEEFFDGDEVVVVTARERGRGRGSGVEVDRHVTFLCRLRAGRVSEIRLYADRGPALQDAGLAGEAMSRDSVEIVEVLMAAVNRRDIDTFDRVTTADFEWFPVFAARVEGDVYRGREGIEAFLGEVDETWEEFHPLPDEYRDLGDRVLALGRLKTRGRGSGVPIDAPWGCVYDVRDGKISRIRTYLDHGEALRAASLSE